MKKINCTIGILTKNSEATLDRSLASVKNFADIIIADGGSSDSTITIAKAYGAKIISQIAVGKPIDDFSSERNNLLDHAVTDWFFYLDSDEVMTEALAYEIEKAVENASGPSFYNVPYVLTSPDLTVWYKSIRPLYQVRLFRKSTGARFAKRVHEKIHFDPTKEIIGTLSSPWLVPLDVQLAFRVYKEKVHHRLGIIAYDWKPPSLSKALYTAWLVPFFMILKIFLRMFYLRLRYKARYLVPLRYELYRIYSQIYIAKVLTKKIFTV
ncbi:glycosyltransferase family 2 protein [Candidatus Nomurabacteria bacterium]|jgi:glycosyltransferase involved in cell wall biosynthesis|nr:MAG: glycosyltransferase family 2 protein [Candidatus Nomurabacteria bacterium]